MKNYVDKIFRILEKTHPDAKIALNFSNEFELLVAVQLSAQCTDVRVNLVTPKLFARYKKVEDYANAKTAEFEKRIFPTGFYRNKTKNILGAAKMLVKDFNGKLPDNMAELLKLPGVARKSANVILNNAFKKNEGVVVDTHVMRLSGRMGFVPVKLAKAKNAVKIERELMKKVPQKDWGKFSDYMVFHGRRICTARKPKCNECPLSKICPSAFKV